LITLGVLFLYLLIDVLVVFGISFFLVPFYPIPQAPIAAFILIGLIVPAAFCVTGGIFCLRRKYWRVCLASASFAVFFLVWDLGGSLLSSNIPMGLIPWVILVAEVIAVIFILRTKKEWQEISDSVDGKVSYGG
jgi:glucose-6-phosphate-specific signal transduction histidine kinase